MDTVLMCPPTYYTIRYEINPWMNLKKPADTSAAQQQWETLYNTLKNKLKINIQLIDPDKALPDMVFTANAGLVKEKKVICSNFRHNQRKPEKNHFVRWFKKNGYDTIRLPEKYYFEGEGDALFAGDTLFAGYRYRSDIHTHTLISTILDIRVVSLELKNPYFYHLDTCFCPVTENTLFYYPKAFDSYANAAIKNLVTNKITIQKKEAIAFSCNAVVYKKKIVMNKGAHAIRATLEKAGFSVYEIDLSEFIKAGGSAKCLVLWV